MSPRGFVILLVVTVLAAIGAIVMAVQPAASDTDAVAGDPMFPALSQKLADAGEISVTTPQYTITWKRQGDGWVSPERGDYPAHKGTVSDLVSSLAHMTKVEAKTAEPDWYQYIKVGDPSATPPTGIAHMVVKSADGQVLADVVLGARSYSIAASHARGGMFVRAPDDKQSWLVEGVASAPTELQEWFDAVVDIPASDVAGLTILMGDKTVFEARKTDETNGNYELVQVDPAQAAGDSAANSNSIRSTASAIVGLRADDIRAIDSMSPGEDARTDRFTTASGLTLDVTMFDADGRTWAIFKASAVEGSGAAKLAADINSRAANWAFWLDASRTTRLMQPVANLVQKPGNPAASGAGSIPLDGNGKPMIAPAMPNMPGLGGAGGPMLPTF
jgi:hypothetical protein